ncbi:hypothetical protein BDM02DRAFT_1247331 [Thelephora ganbajun]|uniref:Uncharacterized protein n=1 Tax=Thelephora ganbajun TaxID=370292 RepID=A0ACB6Z3N4_THEGA|nr:hypothetical protein BDM02DRAFT_1247331 [Thelephora ganbajun]
MGYFHLFFCVEHCTEHAVCFSSDPLSFLRVVLSCIASCISTYNCACPRNVAHPFKTVITANCRSKSSTLGPRHHLLPLCQRCVARFIGFITLISEVACSSFPPSYRHENSTPSLSALHQTHSSPCCQLPCNSTRCLHMMYTYCRPTPKAQGATSTPLDPKLDDAPPMARPLEDPRGHKISQTQGCPIVHRY